MAPPEGQRVNGSGIPAISVVIPHLNQPELLAGCLAALARQTLAPDRFEVVVVDNGSRELPVAAVAGFPGAVLVREEEPGPGPARNRGVAMARAAIIAFTDADCLPDPGWLAAIEARFAADPALGVLGGEVQVFAADPARPTPAEAFDLVYGFRQQLQIARHRFAATANLAVRRTVFEAVGPFAGLSVAEDMDWGQRAAATGHPTRYAAEALVRHPARRTMAELRRQWDRHIDHHHTMQTRRPVGRLRWLLAAGAVALSPAREVATVLRASALPDARARLRAWTATAEIRLYRARRMLHVMRRSAVGDGRNLWNRL
jgi:GT2 family glycosyltransferase